MAALNSMRAAWRKHGSKEDMTGIGRELRALTELRVRAGHAFYFDKPLVPNFVDTVFGQTVDLLIMY